MATSFKLNRQSNCEWLEISKRPKALKTNEKVIRRLAIHTLQQEHKDKRKPKKTSTSVEYFAQLRVKYRKENIQSSK